MEKIKLEVKTIDIANVIQRKRMYGEIHGCNGIMYEVIKRTMKMKGFQTTNKFYFDNSRFFLKNIPDDVIMKIKEIEENEAVNEFEFEVEYEEAIPF